MRIGHALILTLCISAQAFACGNDGNWYPHLTVEQRLFPATVLRMIDAGVRQTFYDAIPTSAHRQQIEELIPLSIDRLYQEAPKVFEHLSFLGMLYTLGMVNFDQYQKIRARSHFSDTDTESVIHALKWLTGHADTMIAWARTMDPLSWKPIFYSQSSRSNQNPKKQPYIITGEKNEGGFGKILEAHFSFQGLPTQNPLAIKVTDYATALPLREELRERLSRTENLSANLLQLHPHTIVPFGNFRFMKHDISIMPLLLDGYELDDYDHLRQAIPIKERLSHLLAVAKHLDRARSLGVYHYDISPGNIHMDENAESYVLDFGVSQIAFWEQTRNFTHPRLNILGTHPYVAPEVRKYGADKHSELSQVYALGAILYKIVTLDERITNFDTGNPNAINLAYYYLEEIPDRYALFMVSPDLYTFFRSATRTNTSQRIRTIRRFIERLERIVSQLSDE